MWWFRANGSRRQWWPWRRLQPVAVAQFRLGVLPLAEHCQRVLGEQPDAAWLAGTANRCLSLRVRAGQRHFKVFECASVTRAEEVAAVMRRVRAHAPLMPQVHGVSAHVVIADWVEGVSGRTLSRRKRHTALIDLLEALHAVPVDVTDPQVRHADWIWRRLGQLATARVGADRVASLEAAVKALSPATSPTRVVHPDVIPANVVCGVDGPCVVDNEFVAVSRGFELDVLNAADALYRARRQRLEQFVADYAARADAGTLFTHRAYWEATLQAQRIAGALARGKHGKAGRLLDEMEAQL